MNALSSLPQVTLAVSSAELPVGPDDAVCATLAEL